ncbi:MAG: hypothetical protein ABI972_30720 [Acidobacteriota bacterium]
MSLTRRESNLFILAVASVCAVAAPLRADVSQCGCDITAAETMAKRECSLCNEAEKHPPETAIFLLKDNNPRKPTRWLALPRKHGTGPHALQQMPREEQVALLKAAIEKGRELFGDEWGIAYNSWRVRTQCHGHVHIGKLLKGLAPGQYVDVSRVEDIRLPKDDGGFWIHPVGAKLRIHFGEDITETTLLR